ncbi:MAG: NAD(P)H-dependent oxidoreductase [Pseudomonadota bacterium]
MLQSTADRVGGKTILNVESSARYEGSQSRALAAELIAALAERHDVSEVITRDVAQGLEFVDEAWLGANFTDESERTEAQRQRLATSDALIDEVMRADTLVIGVPIYNFGIPAALKAWIDQICRARKTFRYTENGPVGLLDGKKAYVIVASGGTEAESAIDFATGYMRHVLGFIGIHDVTVISADRLMVDADAALARARTDINAVRFPAIVAE